MAFNNNNNRIVDDNIIQKILSNYIKHRNYKQQTTTNNENNNNSTTTRNDNVLPAKDWFLEGALSAFQSIRNVATLRLTEEDFVKEVEISFRKFIEFINQIRLKSPQIDDNINAGNPRRIPQHGEELWMTCFPLFVHIFIQLFECGYIAIAQNFFIEHYQRFTKKSNHVQFLTSMQSSLNNRVLNSALQNFKNFKCRIMITEESFNLLTQFLKDEKHLSILQTFNSCLDFRVMTQEEYCNQQASQTGVSSSSTASSSSIIRKNQLNNNENDDFLSKNLSNPANSDEMNKILNIIKSMNDNDADDDKNNVNNQSDYNNYPTKAYQTTICLCRMQTEDISSVTTSKNLSKIVVGTEQSEIHLWDCDLTDELQYYSSRIYRHWKRIPIRRLTSEIDFKFINPKTLGNEIDMESSGKDDNNFDDRVYPQIFRGHSNAIYEMSFLNDSNLLLSCSGDTTIRAWDVNSNSCLSVYKGHASAIWTIDSNDSGCFISGGRDGVAHMWDIERTIPMRIYSGHLMDINQIKFHPNCNYLATASSDKTIILWDVNQVRQVRMFCGHKSAVNTIQFSSCGKYLTSASEDGSICIWDISQGTCLNEMKNHQDNIRCLNFGPNEHLLASCGIQTSTINIWENPIVYSRQQKSVPFISFDVNNSMNIGENDESSSEVRKQNLMKLQFIRRNILLAFSRNV